MKTENPAAEAVILLAKVPQRRGRQGLTMALRQGVS